MTRFLALAALLSACNGTPSDNAGARDVTGVARSPLTMAVGSSIQAWHVRADGSMEPASPVGLRTDEFGRYSIRLDGADSDPLVIVAVFDDGTTGTVLTGGSARSVKAPPMTHESAVEAAIYQRAVARGLDDDDGQAALLRAFVPADVAAGWDDLGDAQRDDVALAIGEALQAWQDAGGVATDEALPALAEATRVADARAFDSGVATTDADSEIALVTAWEHAGADTEDLSFMAAAASLAHDALGIDSALCAAESTFLDGLRGRLAEDAARRLAPSLTGEGKNRMNVDPRLLATSVRRDGPDLFFAIGSLSDAQYRTLNGQVAYAQAAADGVPALMEDTRPEQTGEMAAVAINDFRATVRTEAKIELLSSGNFDEQQSNALAQLLTLLYCDI